MPSSIVLSGVALLNLAAPNSSPARACNIFLPLCDAMCLATARLSNQKDTYLKVCFLYYLHCSLGPHYLLPGISCSRFQTSFFLTDVWLFMSFCHQTTICLKHRRGCRISILKSFYGFHFMSWSPKPLVCHSGTSQFWSEPNFSNLSGEEWKLRSLGACPEFPAC